MVPINFNRTPVTLIMMAAAVALELICTFDDLQGNGFRRGYYYNDAQLGIWLQIWQGQIWRPFTTTVLHGDLFHLIMNLSVFYRFGPALEVRLGSYRMLGLIVLLAYVSSLSQYILGNYFIPNWQDQDAMVGLSGILFGMVGFMAVGRHYDRDLEAALSLDILRFVGILFVVLVVLTRFGALNVANIAHASGFIFGGLYALAYFPTPRRKLWIVLAVLATSSVLATLIACPGHAGYERAIL